VGRAYGLEGDHHLWARTPQQNLAEQIASAAPRVMAPKVSSLGVAADPFAAPGGAPPGQSPSQGMDSAFQAIREAELAPSGVPAKKPAWLLPVIVGVLALAIGGAVTLAFMR
jgi:hypothetical protein